MKPLLIYHAAEPVPLRDEVERPTVVSRIRTAMVTEGTLIASNVKVFLGSMGVAVLGVTEMTTGGGSWQDNTILGLLVATICFLFRQLIVERKENAERERKLWERLVKKENGDGDDSVPQRHRRK